MTGSTAAKPLTGIRVIELAGLGPAPLACTMLADMGCGVIRVERTSQEANPLDAQLSRIGVRPRTTLAVDLKADDGQQVVRTLVDSADVVVEAFRPGTTERLGIGPERFTESNPGLIYVRLTGWGQLGPYATMAGHDINYIALTGALDAIGGESRPLPPLNLLGDYAGGSLFAIVATLGALVERSRTGMGSIIDTAMIDGVSTLMTPIKDLSSLGAWVEERSSNLLDGGAPFYRTYETSDGRFMAVGALEPRFYTAFVAGLELEEANLPNRFDPENWDSLAATFAEAFLGESRDHWQAAFEDTDGCVTPVLTMSESRDHPQNRTRQHEFIAEPPSADAARVALLEAGIASEQIDALVGSDVIELR